MLPLLPAVVYVMSLPSPLLLPLTLLTVWLVLASLKLFVLPAPQLMLPLLLL